MTLELKDLYVRKGSVAQDYIDISQEIFVEINNYFKIVDCNLRFCKFMNKPRTELFGASVLDALSEKDKVRFQNLIRNALLKKFREGLLKFELVDYKKRSFTVSLKIHPVLNEDNKIVGFLLNFSLFKVRFEDSPVNTIFMSIHNSLNDLYTIYATDTKNRINHVNDSLTNILGYSKDEMMGRHISDFLVKNKEQEENIKRLIKFTDESGKFTGEVLYEAKSGEEIPIHLSVSPLIHNGKSIGSLGIGRDMREQKRLETENKTFAIQIQNQSKMAEFGMMLQGVAHNMSTPLSGIKSSAQLQHSRLDTLKVQLKEKNRTDSETEESINDIMKFFELIDQSVSKLSRIIKNLMSKARDQQNLNREMLNLGEVIWQELEFLQSNQFFKNKVEKNFDIRKDIPVIFGLYSDFSQSFVNIIKNGIDAMWNSQTRKMGVKVYYEDDVIYIKISDTGKGIPESIGEKIFQPFFTTKPKFRDASGDEPTGTGIGLDSVKTLLSPYHADISFTSEVGKGTEFVIQIPVSINQKK